MFKRDMHFLNVLSFSTLTFTFINKVFQKKKPYLYL